MNLLRQSYPRHSYVTCLWLFSLTWSTVLAVMLSLGLGLALAFSGLSIDLGLELCGRVLLTVLALLLLCWNAFRNRVF